MGVSLELAEGIQADCYADDVPMPKDLGSSRWSEIALRTFFESGGETIPPMISTTPSKAPAVKARLEAQVAPARGEAIAETVISHQQAAQARAAAALEARSAKAGQENAKAMRVKGDRDAFDTFVQESRRELSELSLVAASSNRAAALDEKRTRAAAESLKVRAGVATASLRAEGKAAIKEIKHNDKMTAAAERKADILAARQQKAALLAGTPVKGTPVKSCSPAAATASVVDSSMAATSGGSRPSGLQLAVGVAVGALAWMVACRSSELMDGDLRIH